VVSQYVEITHLAFSPTAPIPDGELELLPQNKILVQGLCSNAQGTDAPAELSVQTNEIVIENPPHTNENSTAIMLQLTSSTNCFACKWIFNFTCKSYVQFVVHVLTFSAYTDWVIEQDLGDNEPDVHLLLHLSSI